MAYTVIWKKQPGGEVINDLVYNDLDEAIANANLPMAVPFTVEVAVFDEDGNRKHIVVVGDRPN